MDKTVCTLCENNTTTGLLKFMSLGLNEVARLTPRNGKSKKQVGFEGTLLDFRVCDRSQLKPFKTRE
jgi:hypothetical protein